MENNNWRNEDARQKIVNKIMDTLHRHMPQTGVDGMQELRKIAIRFEEKIFSNSQNQQDYLRKISMKMLSLETKANNNNNQFPAGANQRPIEHNPMLMQQQMRNQAQNLSNGMPLPAQSQVQQLQQNLQSNISANGMTNSAGVGSSLNNVSNLTQQQNPNIGAQGPGLQTMSGMNQNSMNTNPTQVYNQNLLAQRQMQARQQQLPQQTLQQQNPQSQAQQQMFFKQQQASLLQQKNQQQYQQLQSSMLQQQQQQQQQSLSQNTLQQTQPPMFQQTQQSTLQSTQSAMLQQSQPSMMQQSQQNIYQQTQQSNSQAASQPVLQHQQQVMRQQQQQQQHPVMQQQQQQQQQQSMAQQPMLPTQQQHPQLMGSQTSFQQHQHTLQHLLQSKNQQSHQGSASLLQQQQPQQNQLLPQLQPQAQNMQTQQQQQQQQQQMMQQPMQHDLQQRLQASGGLLPQQQNTLDQQKQLLQQRGLSEASSTSVESSSQAGQPVIAEWQEKVYQRLQAMKDSYFVELKDLFQKLNYRCQKPMPPDQSEKFKHYKAQLQRVLNYFNAPKNAIPVNFKEEHVEALEKRVQNILNSFRPKPSAQQQPGQQQIQNQMGQGQPMQQQIQNQMGQGQPIQQQSQPQMGHMQSMQQQSQSQMGQVPQEQKHVTPFQQMNLQPSVSSMQPNTVAPLQNSTMPLIQQSSGQASQQTMQTPMQSQAALNTQGANVNSLQQSSANQIAHNPLQHNNISSLQQRGINSMQSSVQQGSNNPHGHIQQAQQFKHLQQQRILQMQQQKQAAQLQHQLQAPQVSQLQQLNDNDAKLKQGPMKSTFMQPHQMNQRAVLQQQQQQQQHLKQASSLSASSPQILPAGSPQVSQQSSPQVDQQSLLASPLQTSKVGTPLQPATSPFLNPSPSNLPVPSPLIDDSERQPLVTTSVSNVAGTQGFQQSVSAMSHAPSLAIGTPGISASPLLADFSPSPAQNNLNQDGTQIVSSGIMAAEKSNITEPPLERIMKVMGSMSSKSMASVVNDIGSVVSLMDRMAGSAPGNGSRAAVGEDLVAMTKCRLQARNLMSQDGSAATKKMRRCISSMPLSTVSSAGTVSNSFQQHSSVESPEMDSTATSKVKKSRVEMIHALEEEIQEINNQLIDTVVEVSEDDNDAAAAASEGRDGTLVKCSYMAMALSPCMKSHYHSSQVIPISPLRLLIPESYPNSSPVLLDRTPVQACSKEYADLSSRAKEYFHLAVRTLPQPMSLKALVKIWDECARSTVAEYAHRSGGGSFSSRFGRWESCASA